MFVTFLLTVLLAAAPPATQPTVEYLSDVRYRMVHRQQGWGQLGLNTCAFERGKKPEPLRIGEKEYGKGLGHHAPGELIIDLGGDYEQFEAEVGLQPLEGGTGSAVFQVFVDDQQKFDSGVIRAADPPKIVSIPLSGAMELRLVVTDAGDGIINDCANWADARLTRSASPKPPPVTSMLDVAPFGQVITCDPARDTGAQSKRIEEYRAEDIFLETPLKQEEQNGFTIPSYPGGQCIGLRWIERRPIRELGIEFNGPVPPTQGVQVQCWMGPSLWQDNWKPLGGLLDKTETGWRFVVDWSNMPEAKNGTRKIRWILPPGEQSISIRRLTAITSTPLGSVDLSLQLEKPSSGPIAHVRIYNGQLADSDPAGITKDWDLAQPLLLQVRYTRPRPWKSDSTELRIQLPDRAFSVAIDDVIKNGCVYVRQAGLFVTQKDGPSLAEYKKLIEGKKTILQEVRDLPDQTFAQAIDKVHNPKQNLQPMLLSLACDNHKFAVHRDGTIQFAKEPDKADQFAGHPIKYPLQMTPKFGSGKNTKIRRYLEEGWLPAPVIEVEDGGVTYRQRTYVVDTLYPTTNPFQPTTRPGEHNPTRPVCVVEFSVLKNESNAPGTFELTFTTDIAKGELAKLTLAGNICGLSVLDGDRVLAESGCFDPHQKAPEVKDGRFLFTQWGNSIFRVYLFTWPGKSELHDEPPATFERFRTYWSDLMSSAMQADLPDPLLTNVIRASQVHCLLAARNEENGQRIAPWIASFVYGPLESESNTIIRGMDHWGHHEFARRSLDFFINKYNPAGFLTTGYTLMGTGWHLWTLGEHYQLTRDDAWMKSVAPKVAKVCEWITNQRAKTQKETPTNDRPPEYGLVPPGVLADWNAYAYYFCLNGYYYKGLLEAARALVMIGHGGALKLLNDAVKFRKDILRAYHRTQSQMPVYPLRDGTSVPGYPSQLTAPGPSNNFFPGEDGNRSWCYDVELGAHQLVPQGVLDPQSPEVADMMDHMEDVQFLAEGWFDYAAERNQKDAYNLGGFAKVQPYYCRNIEIDALRDDVKPFIRSYFNTMPSLLGFETLSFQEHFNGVAAWNKTHETGYFLYYSRLMLVQERDDELWLAPFVTSNWLKDGAEIKVKNAPTRFGPVSYRIKSAITNGQIEAEIEPPTRQPPQSIVLRLRHPEGKTATIQKVTGVNSESISIEKEQIGQEKSNRVVIDHTEGSKPIHILIGYSN